MHYSTTNRLKLLADQLEEKIADAAGDVEGAVNDLEREVAETRKLSELILTRLDDILDRLKHPHRHREDDKQCSCGEPLCSCAEH